MKKFVKTSVATAVVMGAALIAGSASAGITNTLHNMGTTGSGTNVTTAGTGEICVFCHTPHGSDTSAAVPLWNKLLPESNTFTTYDQLGTTTLDGGITDVGSVTIACLSCHDGSQAMDNILNAPGSGGYTTDGGSTNGLGYTWSTGGTVDSNGLLTAGITQIGKDLQDDHPIGVQYAGGGYKSTVTAGPGADADFVAAQYSNNRWWVDNTTMQGNGSTAATLDKWDFKLYTRTDAGAGFANEDEPFVECGSCHDPHMETDTFLRIDASVIGGMTNSNDGSAVCLACHTK